MQETQQGDVYPGSFGTDVYFGRTSAMMPKISLFFQITYWLDQSWGSYYMDFTSIYGQPSQFHTTRIIQKDISWLFGTAPSTGTCSLSRDTRPTPSSRSRVMQTMYASAR